MKFPMKKRFFALIVILVFGLFLTGCNSSSDAPSPPATEDALSPLRIATLPALESIPIFIAQNHGFFEDEGLVVYIEHFFNPRDRDIAFLADETIDGMVFDLVQLVIYQEGGLDLVATTGTIGLAGVISQPHITSIADLAGQNVLSTTNTSMDYVLDRALASGGLSMADVIIDEVPALPTRLEMLLHDQAAAAMLPDPFAALGIEEGKNLLITTRDLGINPFVLAFRREVTQYNLESLQAFYRAINRAIEFLNNSDREEFIDLLIETVGYPPHVRDTLVVPHFPAYQLPTAAIVEDVLAFAQDRGLLTIELSVADIIFDIAP